MRSDTLAKLEVVRLDRALRYEQASGRLMGLAWAIEIVAVLIGLSIAFSRVIDANQAGTAVVSFWGSIQLMGGFLIVSMGELTKIPLSMLLVNVRLLFKPLVLLVVVFVSGITFETVFLSLERGYNFQKSDIHAYRDAVIAAKARLDTGDERARIERIGVLIDTERVALEDLAGDHATNLGFIDEKYAGAGEAVKPAGYDGAEGTVRDLQAQLAALNADHQARLDAIARDFAAAMAIYDADGAGVTGEGADQSPEIVAMDTSIAGLKAQKADLEAALKAKVADIQTEYENSKRSYQQSIDRANEAGDTNEAARYQELIERLAPKTERDAAKRQADARIAEVDDDIARALAERAAIALRDARSRTLVVNETGSGRTRVLEDARSAATAQRVAAQAEMQARRDDLAGQLAAAQERLDVLENAWRTKRDVLTQALAEERAEQVADAAQSYALQQEAKRAVIEDLRNEQRILSEAISAAEQDGDEARTALAAQQRLLCDALLGNQIYRISTRFDTTGLFGSERSPDAAARAGQPDADCPTQVYVDEANADRVAFIWFGSIALLAATAGAATAITAQGFLRMAEALRWQPPEMPGAKAGLLSGSLRRALVHWRWRRVKTVEVVRVTEVPVEVVRTVETIREVDHVIRELVPVPVFVPTGGNVEAEMAKVRGHYEDMNRLARAVLPVQALTAGPEAGVQAGQAADGDIAGADDGGAAGSMDAADATAAVEAADAPVTDATATVAAGDALAVSVPDGGAAPQPVLADACADAGTDAGTDAPQDAPKAQVPHDA